MGWLFRSGVYNQTLRAEPIKPRAIIPTLIPGNAELGRALRVGDLIKTLRVIERPAGEKNYDQALSASVHRFRWLADLCASGLESTPTVVSELMALWIDQHARWQAVSWIPNVLAERLGHWLVHSAFLLRASDDIFRDQFLSSLHRQAIHLKRALALGGSPGDGFFVAKAEVFYHLMFGPQVFRAEDSLNGLARQISDELLPDGGHRSRNPSLHLMALRNLIEIRDALSINGQNSPVWLLVAIDQMAPMLRSFRHGDGGLCLFNGSRPETSDAIDMVLDLAVSKGRAITNAAHSGFQRLSAGQSVIVMDIGVPDLVGDDENSGTLAFELSNGRRRIVVNCGVPEMPSPALREICRGSAAHSTLVLADTNSSEMQGAAAMGGRRAHRTHNMRQDIEKNTLVESEHNGYQPLFGLNHRRALYLSADGLDVRGEDSLTGNGAPHGGVQGVVRFHLHPEIGATLVEDGRSVLLRAGKMQGWRFQSSAKGIRLEDSVYFGDGPRRQCRQIVIAFDHRASPTVLKWRFQREK